MLLRETLSFDRSLTDTSPLLSVLQIRAWQQIPNLVHGFCTRRGGISRGPYSELNLSYRVGDAASAVEENWSRVRAHTLGRLRLVTMNQVHGTRVAEVEAAAEPPGDADAMVTSAGGIGLCVLTADCVPILIVAPAARVVAAVHAGWRGSVGGVAVAALQHMTHQMGVRAGEVLAAIGPAIGPCCYEVDGLIADDIEARWGAMPDAIDRYQREGEAKAKLDLRVVNTKLLVDAGLGPETISQIGGCTACKSDQFYSYRAASQGGAAAVTGRQLSFIGSAL